ncbi:MAG TPA: hypothetical protein PK082_02970, partial [Phycisphaerae bacterium]|nr:hypothetical protein [Phycisphaerae bacterium]
ANSASEASILSATSATNETFRLTGNCDIDGDLFMTNPDGYASLTGNVTVGGVSASDPAIAEHIHIGVPDAPFPEVDPSVFAPFATCLVDSGTSTSGNKTFNNIRIKAGTNPTFSGNIQLNGVIFIETPNRVHFSGNVTLKGVIVTEDAGDDVYDTNTIKFTGNMTARGVEELPDTPEFHDLRQMPGSFLLAPGFGVEFTGNFGTVGGTMAADSYKFTGNAGGIVKGSVICYSDSDFKLTGNSSLTIDRSGNPETPPGFSLPPTFTMTVSTYQEY